ncbi:MAG: ABC transporter substrate-binding protein/permease [Myxococcota bacterium]
MCVPLPCHTGVVTRGLTLVLLGGLLQLGCAREEGGSALEAVRRAGVLRWGVDIQGGEPYAFEDPEQPGKLIGFEVEIADAIARELGVRAEPVQNDWSNLIPSLERGTFDIALNGLEVTPSRAGRVRFSRPYYVFALVLTAREGDARVVDLASLKGHRVGTLANSLAWETLLQVGAEAVPYEGVREPYLDLAAGRTDAVLMDDMIASRYGADVPGLRTVGEVGEGRYAIAVRPADNDLAVAVDDALGKLLQSGELRKILARWKLDNARQEKLSHDVDTGAPSSQRALSGGHVLLFLQAAGMTLLVSTAAMLLASLLGLVLAILRRHGPGAVSALCVIYVELFRGTPLLLQLYVLYYGLAGVLDLGPVTASVLGLGLNYAAYEAEVYRAAMTSVPRGQMEAALSLGMTTPLALRRIILPQALRTALPGVTNDFIALLKDSSLVSVLTVVELTKRMTITAVDVRSWFLPGLLCAAMYLAMSLPLSRWARHLESRLVRA